LLFLIYLGGEVGKGEVKWLVKFYFKIKRKAANFGIIKKISLYFPYLLYYFFMGILYLFMRREKFIFV
jgi:hypothetical protein